MSRPDGCTCTDCPDCGAAHMVCAVCHRCTRCSNHVEGCEGCPAPSYEPAPRCYRIIRFRQNGRPRTLRNNVTLAEAQAHCSRPDTHGTRGGVRWFDGYDYMRGCRPREED